MNTATAKKTMAKHQRGHLSRNGIAQAGLSVARQDGVDKLTMKRLAQALKVTPMAIYRHFDDKSDLIDAVLELFVKENDICNHEIPVQEWDAWLKRTYTKMYEGLQSMPSVYPYLSSAARFGPSASEVVEQTLLVMQQAGFSFVRATQAANALNGFVIGCAIMDNAFYQGLAKENSSKQKIGQRVMQEGIEPSLENGLELIISALRYELTH